MLQITGLKVYFPLRGGLLPGARRYVKAVDGVDLAVQRGKTLGLVGESGSGKTTVGRAILRLLPARQGKVLFDGQDVLAMKGQALKDFRRKTAMIFQDPAGSLNPRMTVGGIVAEPLRAHSDMTARQRRAHAEALLERVGLARQYASRYPHEFSGGQRQRIGIARALACRPELIVCDEPVSALDVSIQAQILNLLSDLQQEFHLTYLFIAHNLAVVEHFADDVAVMYLGRVMEVMPRSALAAGASGVLHPYTQSLLSAVPRLDAADRSARTPLPGEMPSPVHPPSGCLFHTRCPLTRQLASSLPAGQTVPILSEGSPVRIVGRCARECPALSPAPGRPGHAHACLLRPS
ncbi:MAG: ATP-binding cassette domain-containing protein [Planctomycetota bacterium]|nr:ATP-binding cassette domain-containing protein [Planctomycetota bacterium]